MQQITCYIIENGLLAVSRLIGLGLLAGLSAADLKYRRIPGSMLMLGTALAAGYVLSAASVHIRPALGGLLVGLVFVLVSRVTREQLGYGDSWLLCILGVYLGTWNLLALLCTAWMTAALAAAAVLAARRYGRGTALPMVPFITAGYVVMWAGEILS